MTKLAFIIATIALVAFVAAFTGHGGLVAGHGSEGNYTVIVK